MKEYYNKHRLKSRWLPSYTNSDGTTLDTFLGYANELDVWFDPREIMVSIVGPPAKLLGLTACNFDAFYVRNGLLDPLPQPRDVHIDPHDMSLIYQLCEEHNLLKLESEQDDEDD